MSAVETPAAAVRKYSVAAAWSRALEATAPIARNPTRTLPTVVAERATTHPDRVALVSAGETLTYRELDDRARRYAAWAQEHALAGQTVALLMPNSPTYVAAWLGLTSVGVAVALLNTNAKGSALAHSLNVVRASHLLADREYEDVVQQALPDVDTALAVSSGRIPPGEPSDAGGGVGATVEDTALYIYTSGTTGLPKAARVTHARIMQWSHWFCGLLDVRADDRMYNCLPMYHSIGGVVAIGAMLAGGGSVVIRDRFSATQFWREVARWDCTLFQYIGELCRYLLDAPFDEHERDHHLRMCAGNGLSADVWEPFKRRFAIPRVLEFYASTEGNVSLFNVEERPGAIGRIPPFLAHRFPAAVVRIDAELGAPVRTADGLCVRCAPDEPGELLGQLIRDRANVGARFDGYTDEEASQAKIIRDVFAAGDAWVRTGDLVRRDAQGFFYFVDRIGDTFRWKGENVATSEVAGVLHAFPGVTQAVVYGVTMPNADGRAGMAAVTGLDESDLQTLRVHLVAALPRYARPLFVRLRSELEHTSTFKWTKQTLVREGYDPRATSDPIYFDDPTAQAFVRVDDGLHGQIVTGAIRL